MQQWKQLKNKYINIDIKRFIIEPIILYFVQVYYM